MGLQHPDKWIGRVGWETTCGPTPRKAFNRTLAQSKERYPDEYATTVSEWEAQQLGAATPHPVARWDDRSGL